MSKHEILLGVNIDHVATLRQVRGTAYPDPLQAAFMVTDAGADSITVHLREDRRHILDRDVRALAECITIPLNLEMAVTDEMVALAAAIKPAHCCLVPEKRQELTTEGGLDVLGAQSRIRQVVEQLTAQGIEVSLFIDPDKAQIDAAKQVGAAAIELHTGAYAEASSLQQGQLLRVLQAAAVHAAEQGLIVNAGHGLHYHNVGPLLTLSSLNTLNIGHAIIARALFSGLAMAVRDMKALLR